MNPERTIVGLCTVYDVPCRNDGDVWHASEFEDFVNSGEGAYMWLDHHEPIRALGEQSLGHWRAFASVPAYGDRPAGLLAIGEFDQSAFADGMLADLHNALEPWGDPTGVPVFLSVTAQDRSTYEDGSVRWIREVSLTAVPAFADARVMAVGTAAAHMWELLTDSKPPWVPKTTPRTVTRRLLGVHDGRIVWGDD